MNKKGLILIFLFVVSTVGAVALTNAAPGDNKVDVIFNYVPSAYVDMGEVYVEFDSRFLDDNMVFGQNDVINFAFYYDVCVETWGGATTTGGGLQPEVWFYEPQNNASEGYIGSDLYNTTRFVGTFDVLLDDYDLGMTNFDIWADVGNYQDIPISLDIGWHYMTIVAAELVSDANHTEWHWEYAKDEKQFYVAETRSEVPTLQEDARFNEINVTATAVNSEDLDQGYNWTSFLVSPRPLAFSVTSYHTEELGLETDAANVTTELEVEYNASDTTLGLADGTYGLTYTSIYEMGPLTYMWILNNGDMDIANDTYTPEIIKGLRQGQNIVYFILFGFRVDDYSQLYGNPAPQLATDVALFRIWVGPLPDSTGPSFGILISVSILGLAAALLFVRRRR